jgi:hypothetical protein
MMVDGHWQVHMQSNILNSYLALMQARHNASKPAGTPTAYLFSTFFFSKLLEGVSTDSGTSQDDPDWAVNTRSRTRHKRRQKEASAAQQPPQKRVLLGPLCPRV